jgi:outer membrane protein
MKTNVSAVFGLLTAMALTGAAGAQTAAPAAAAAQPAPGPMIPGVCTYNNERAITTSAVGQAVIARMKQLSAAVDAELKADRASLETERQTLEASRTTMPQEQLEQRALAFNQKAAAYERKTQQRVQELQATEAKQLQKIAENLDPILKAVYSEKNCGLMLDRNTLYGANPAMDVTPTVITKLNAKITTLTFERERAEQQAARPATGTQAAARPPAPAAKAPVKK